jgi:hypothetical protein
MQRGGSKAKQSKAKRSAAMAQGGRTAKAEGLSEPGVEGIPWHPQILIDQFTLSQPRGQIMPTTTLPPPHGF